MVSGLSFLYLEIVAGLHLLFVSGLLQLSPLLSLLLLLLFSFLQVIEIIQIYFVVF